MAYRVMAADCGAVGLTRSGCVFVYNSVHVFVYSCERVKNSHLGIKSKKESPVLTPHLVTTGMVVLRERMLG